VSPARVRSAVFILVHYVPERGGRTTQTRLEGGELRRRGWDVDVLTRRQSIEWAKTEQIDGIAVHRFGRTARQRAASRHSVAAVIDACDQVWTSRRTGGRGLAVDGGAQTLE
jgi:hypothetical protein